MKIMNFNAGPSILPGEVFEEASNAILNFNNSGLSILEIGHRSDLFREVIEEAMKLVKQLMNLGDEHEVIFLPGGASTQFFQVPMNLLGDNEISAYVDTGVWAGKAIKEARLYGHVDIIATGKESGYHSLPKQFVAPKTAKYLHLTTNNTIHGTQWQDLSVFYNSDVPLVADMSSDILSRQIEFNKFHLIYAGAQKNVGAAGVNLVVINPSVLGLVDRKIPTMMDYRNHIENRSLLNTPPVFAIYVCLLTLRWLSKLGGVKAIEKLNIQKASLFYNTLDSLPMFRGTVANEDRSMMNACFVLDDATLEKEFLDECKVNGMIGVKGHRISGGFRVSMYNALPIESVHAFTELMKNFANRKG